jgi:hypothetical protein
LFPKFCLISQVFYFQWFFILIAPKIGEGIVKHKVIETPEVYFHAVGGIEDHIHLVASVPPGLLMSEWIGKLSGVANRREARKAA